MSLENVLFWITVAIIGWLGLRNLISILIGYSHTAPLKKGQRLCHLTSLLLYWGPCAFAILYHSWWPLGVGFALELALRKAIVRSGNIHEAQHPKARPMVLLLILLKALFGRGGKVSAMLKVFDEVDAQVQFCMYLELERQYVMQGTRPELAGALAVQVSKYLMGLDLDAVRQSAAPEKRSDLDACRDQVEIAADSLMRSDPLVNELVHRSLMTKYLLYSCRYGSKWHASVSSANVESLTRRYGGAPPKSDDTDEYARCAQRYICRVQGQNAHDPGSTA